MARNEYCQAYNEGYCGITKERVDHGGLVDCKGNAQGCAHSTSSREWRVAIYNSAKRKFPGNTSLLDALHEGLRL